MSPAEKLKHRAICRIPGCGYFVARPPLDIPTIGGAPSPGLVALAQKLADHLETEHPVEHARLAQSIQLFMGYLLMTMYTLEDPRLTQEYHYTRSVFHRITARYKVTDEQISERLAHMEFESEDEQELTELIRDFRDFLSEEGRYAPDTSQPPLVKL